MSSHTLRERLPFTARDTVEPHRFAAVALAWLLAMIPATGTGQEASIDGIVTSASTRAPLEGVTVVLEAGGASAHGAITDRNGYYQIGGIPPGTYLVRARQLGHAPHLQPVTFGPGERATINIELTLAAVMLDAIVVVPQRGAAVTDLGRQRVTPADLRLVPVPAGSGDLASYLQTLPGVVTTGDRGGQLFVRGGTPAQNLVLMDGIPIYMPFHIAGFFSAFPEELVSSVDFYSGGFGARYSGRTASVLDVGLRSGDPNRHRAIASVSPFLAESVVEGPIVSGISWIASLRRSLIEETSETLLGARQPLTFDSQLLKLTATDGADLRCSVLALRTSDRGRLDAEDRESRVGWDNLLAGGRCVTPLRGFLRLMESSFSYTSVNNVAVSRGSSSFESRVWRMQHDAHVTSLIGAIPLYAGYHLYAEAPTYDLAELYGVRAREQLILGYSSYLETSLPLGGRIEVRPGVVLMASPRAAIEPRLRASWQPFRNPDHRLQGAAGVYRQDLMGTSDIRDVGSVFTAWMRTPGDVPVETLYGSLGWQQSLAGVNWSVEGYYTRMKNIPVPAWSAVAQFNTELQRANGTSHGVDFRAEYSGPRLQLFVGYGYGETQYEVSQPEFASWYGEAVQRYHPPHDRRHQVNALANLELAGFDLSARWQLGTGLPFTRPVGFDEAFDYALRLHDVREGPGAPRLLLDRPFTGRLPTMHRLDVSIRRGFDLAFGRLDAQAGAINAYDQRNMFYYDLFSGRRVDQLPLAPYASLSLRYR